VSDIKLQVGQWYRRRDGEIVYCFAKNPVNVIYPYHLCCEDGTFETCTEDGDWCDEADNDDEDIIEHLPDCTGFDWVPTPKLQLREGAWYERKDGEIVGPCKKSTFPDHQWMIEPWLYFDDGTNKAILDTGVWLIREVEPPQPKYRAFVDREEAFPFCDGWWLDDGEPVRIVRVRQDCVFVGGRVYSFDMAFASLKRHDGTPFGVLDDQ
jgi:hypothetical protein